MFEWDRNNLRKIRAHRIKREETEHALLNDPISIYEQDVEGELRFVYYGETKAGRLLAESKGTKASGSSLVAKLNQKSSVQIAIRLPEADIVQARKLAERKGLGYQTLLKMLVHEGLAREARRELP